MVCFLHLSSPFLPESQEMWATVSYRSAPSPSLFLINLAIDIRVSTVLLSEVHRVPQKVRVLIYSSH